ncbi:MAG: hypothetical protein AB7K24_15280 [Gemmataceae bacterium]
MTEPDDFGDEPQGACVFQHIPDSVDADPLLLATIHALVFLQGSSADVVEPESADDAVGEMLGYLKRLKGKELDRLKAGLKNLSQFARQQKWKPDQIALFDEFIDVLGIE